MRNEPKSFKDSPLVKGGELIVSQDSKRTHEEFGPNLRTQKIQENLGLVRYGKSNDRQMDLIHVA